MEAGVNDVKFRTRARYRRGAFNWRLPTAEEHLAMDGLAQETGILLARGSLLERKLVIPRVDLAPRTKSS